MIEILIPDPKKPPKLKFPPRCVNCGKPQETSLPLKLNMDVQRRGQAIMLEMAVPL